MADEAVAVDGAAAAAAAQEQRRQHLTLEQRVQILENQFERFRHRQANGAFINLNSIKMTIAERIGFAKELLKDTQMKVVGE